MVFTVTYGVFIRKYCELLSRDYWAYERGEKTEHEAHRVAQELAKNGHTSKVEKVYHPGEYPNL